MLRHVTLPMLRPLLLTLVVVSTIWDFKIFDQVYVMTGGGPYRSTELVAITVWREAFARLHLGTAAALAVALFAVLLVMTIGLRPAGPRTKVSSSMRRRTAAPPWRIYAAAAAVGPVRRGAVRLDGAHVDQARGRDLLHEPVAVDVAARSSAATSTCSTPASPPPCATP